MEPQLDISDIKTTTRTIALAADKWNDSRYDNRFNDKSFNNCSLLIANLNFAEMQHIKECKQINNKGYRFR